jgi:hypothetical protein
VSTSYGSHERGDVRALAVTAYTELNVLHTIQYGRMETPGCKWAA